MHDPIPLARFGWTRLTNSCTASMGMGADVTSREGNSFIENDACEDNEEKIDESLSTDSGDANIPDGGYGWVVVTASFFTCWIIGIIYTGFSILYVEFSDYFQAEKGRTGWIGSLYVATGNFLGFIFSGLINHYGCRFVTIIGAVVSSAGFLLSAFAPNITFLYASYGVVAGTGFGMTFMATTVVVQQYFTSKRALAAGLASSGLSMGVVTAGPIIQHLLDAYSWRGTLIMVAGFWLHAIVFGALFRPLPRFRHTSFRQQNLRQVQHKQLSRLKIEKDYDSGSRLTLNSLSLTHEKYTGSLVQLPQIQTTKTSQTLCSGFFMDISLFRNYRLVFFGLGNLLLELGLLTFYHHTPGRAIFHGIERHKVALLPTITGISESCARLVFGFVANRDRVNRTIMFGIGVSLAGVILICYCFITSFIEFAIYCAFMGTIYASFLTVQTTVVVDLLGVEEAANGAAAMAIFKTTGFLVSIPFAGFLYDISGSYDIPFFVAGSLQTLGGALVLCIPIFISGCLRSSCGDKTISSEATSTTSV